jgi:1,2-phenylacetyl-CoA epoxidase catalytic subunit
MAQQTAVEWFVKQLEEFGSDDFKIVFKNQFEQAKAMEKKQIKKAFVEGGVQYMANIGDDIPPKAKDYYNKKYKK